MSKLATLLCLIAFVSMASAFYSSTSKVVKLTSSNFKDLVLNGKEVWFVEFYAPWCGHCKNLIPEWEKLATALDGIVKVGAVDMTTDQDAGAAYGIRGFPTIKFFGANKNSPVDYQGQRSAKEMATFALDEARKVIDNKLGGGGSYGGGSHGGAGAGAGGAGAGAGTGTADEKDVIILTDANFDSALMASDDLWIVEFYAPWCGHCKTLTPEWAKAATELKGEVKVAKIDATQEHTIGGRFGVNSYPQIKLFPSGPKSDSLVESYEGNRDASSIVTWALEKKQQYKPAMKVEQLIDQEVFDKYCTNFRGICFIAFLPHIYDSSASERNSYIEVFEDLAKANRVNPVTFMWSQGGDNYDLEESLGLGSGYPSLIAMSVSKLKYAALTGSFSQKNIDFFVKALLAGKQPLFNLKAAPKVKTVSAWDGEDQKPASYDTNDL